MRILVDLRSLQSGNISGVETFVFNLVSSLCEQFPNAHFYLWTNSHRPLPEDFPKFSYKNASRIHTKYSNVSLALCSTIFRAPKIDRLLQRFALKNDILGPKEYFDLFLVPDPRPTPVSKKIKKITVVHDLTPIHFSKSFSLKTRLWQRFLRIRQEIKESSHILTPSRSTKKDIIQHFQISEENISVIGAGVSEVFRPIRDQVELDEIYTKYDLPHNFLLTLSTLEPRKNLENLIEAFSRFRKKCDSADFSLVIAGTVNPKIFSEITLPKKPNIIFSGFIAEDDKAALYSAAVAFIYPSLFEGFGLPVLEALACGAPVLSSQTTSLPEVYGDAAISFDPHNIGEISEAIETIFLHQNIRTELSQKAIQRAQAPQFSWKTVAEKAMAVFEETTNE